MKLITEASYPFSMAELRAQSGEAVELFTREANNACWLTVLTIHRMVPRHLSFAAATRGKPAQHVHQLKLEREMVEFL